MDEVIIMEGGVKRVGGRCMDGYGWREEYGERSIEG